MTDKDVVFKYYQQGERPDKNCFCHYGWEGTGGFAFWKYAQAYYDSAEVLYEKFTQSKGDYAVLDGLGLTICFLYRHYVELTIKYLFIKYGAKGDEDRCKKFLGNGHRLNKLWKETRAYLKPLKERVGSGVNLCSLDHYVFEIDKFDQDEEAMRYPIKNNLKPMHKPSRLDVNNLHDRMLELHNAFMKLDNDIENQLFDDVPQDSINAFLKKYEELRPRVIWFLESLREIDVKKDKGPVWRSLVEIPQADTQWNKLMELFQSCTDDELILFDTLYYTGQYIRSGNLKLPRNPNEAKKDAVKQCIINMKYDNIEFGDPKMAEMSIEMKSAAAIMRCMPQAVRTIDWNNPAIIERIKQL